MSIPCKIDPLGTFSDGLPVGFKRVEYLESTGTQYIELPFYIQNILGAEIEYIDFKAESDAPMMSCCRYDGSYERFFLPYTSKNIGYYGWVNWVHIGAMTNAKVRSYARLNYTNDRKWSFEFGGNHHGGKLNSELVTQPLSKLQIFCYNGGNPNQAPRFVYGRVFFANVSLGDKVAAKLVPCVDRTGAPCMFDLVSRKPFYNKGTRDFLYPTESTTYSLRRVLPDWGTLTEHGLRRLYHAPANYTGELYDYALENGYKPIIEPEKPEEGYWAPQWRETEDEIVLEWVETEQPMDEFGLPEEPLTETE